MIKIYHNSRCSKSRETLKLIEEQGREMQVINYLVEPPTAGELQELLRKLNMPPEQLIRKGEQLYKEQFAGKQYSAEEWIAIMTVNPVLIERPIVVNGNQAVIGRPPEKVLTIL